MTRAKKKIPIKKMKVGLKEAIPKARPESPAKSGGNTASSKLCWFFPTNVQGQEFGFHDAGYETFRGDYYRFLAREIIQNSLDARLSQNKPVKVTFNQISVLIKDLPQLIGLSDVFKRCEAYWDTKESHEFFQNARKLIEQGELQALKISDYNTTGVTGGDHDRTNEKNWYSLIRCSGASSKSSGEGGSYGIGKNAPFAASQLRTILYSTNTGPGQSNVAFQGVARLVTHETENGVTSQHIGYLGNSDGSSVRVSLDIPKMFRRESRGTNVIVLGFSMSTGWEEQIVLSVVENFWPAILLEKLEVEVGSVKIDKAALPGLLESRKDKCNAHIYYQCFVAGKKFESTLPTLKDVSLTLSTGEIDMPKRVAMVRKSGMVVFNKQFRFAFPYCGVFMCANDEGNQILRSMEPPRHDTWDAHLPERNANVSTQKEYEHFIRDSISNLIDQDQSEVLLIPELGRYLPDDEIVADAKGNSAVPASNGKMEGFPSTPEKPFDRKKLPVGPLSAKSNTSPTIAGDCDDEDYDFDDDDDNEPGEPGKDVGPDNEPKSRQKPDGMAIVPTVFRAFPLDTACSKYRVTIRSTEKKKKLVLVSLTTVGDDLKVALPIREAISNGRRITIQENGRIGPVPLSSGRPIVFEVELENPGKLSMEGVVHET